MVLVHISKRLKEALAVEELFKGAGIDYEVEPDTYVGGIIFRAERTGAFFYVDEEKEDSPPKTFCSVPATNKVI